MHIEISKRQTSIMDFIREHGSVQVDELARHLKVTPQTIRRDLNHLYEMELIQRVHGGAIIRGTVENLGYGARKILMVKEKKAIARLAAQLIPDNSSLFINIGTTTEQVAHYLVDRRNLLVITNNINVASKLWPSRGLEVLVAGGTVRQSDGGIVGATTVDFIDKFKLDYAIIGCSAIDEHGDFCDFDLREVRITQAIIRHARSIILVADSMKLQRNAPVQVGTLEDVDILVTDAGAAPEFIQLCKSYDVDVKIARVADGDAHPTGSRT